MNITVKRITSKHVLSTCKCKLHLSIKKKNQFPSIFKIPKYKTSSQYLPCNTPLGHFSFLDFHCNFLNGSSIPFYPSLILSTLNTTVTVFVLIFELDHCILCSKPSNGYLTLSIWWTRRLYMICFPVSFLTLALMIQLLAHSPLSYFYLSDVPELSRHAAMVELLYILFLWLGLFFFCVSAWLHGLFHPFRPLVTSQQCAL